MAMTAATETYLVFLIVSVTSLIKIKVATHEDPRSPNLFLSGYLLGMERTVIGAGLGGLTAGALLAKSGDSVHVLESHDEPGGRPLNFVDHSQIDSGLAPEGMSVWSR